MKKIRDFLCSDGWFLQAHAVTYSFNHFWYFILKSSIDCIKFSFWIQCMMYVLWVFVLIRILEHKTTKLAQCSSVVSIICCKFCINMYIAIAIWFILHLRSCMCIINSWVFVTFEHLVQDCLDGFTESVQSNYGCLFVGGNVVMATASW